MDQYIHTPITEAVTKELKAGDYVYLSGTVYTARDAAHQRMTEALARGEELPFEIKDAVIYYMGPSPAREGQVIDLPGLQRLVGWINMRRRCSIWGKRQ